MVWKKCIPEEKKETSAPLLVNKNNKKTLASHGTFFYYPIQAWMFARWPLYVDGKNNICRLTGNSYFWNLNQEGYEKLYYNSTLQIPTSYSECCHLLLMCYHFLV